MVGVTERTNLDGGMASVFPIENNAMGTSSL